MWEGTAKLVNKIAVAQINLLLLYYNSSKKTHLLSQHFRTCISTSYEDTMFVSISCINAHVICTRGAKHKVTATKNIGKSNALARLLQVLLQLYSITFPLQTRCQYRCHAMASQNEALLHLKRADWKFSIYGLLLYWD